MRGIDGHRDRRAAPESEMEGEIVTDRCVVQCVRPEGEQWAEVRTLIDPTLPTASAELERCHDDDFDLAELKAGFPIDPEEVKIRAAQVRERDILGLDRPPVVDAAILRRIIETLPEPTPTQVAFLLGQASGLDEGATPSRRAPEDAAAQRPKNERPDPG
jgi:hypothetical protein